ncbi:MAG: hypothetical protein IJV06_05860 [Bacteroidaceae bacterium]|nr:hypothetical protein [Bacteroidaceae bacterium]
MRKQLLLILALIVASAMPNISMAATDYGIKIAGTSVTSDNADNVTNEYIAGGKISYDYSTNTLTLKNVYLKSSNYNQIQILSNVKRQVKVMVEGYNKIEKGSGVSFVIRKPANSDSTNPDVYICGEGVLVLEGGGTIATVDAANVVLGESVNSEKCPLDIYANAFYSLSGGGNLDIFRANLHLTGFSGGTLYGFRYVYMNALINAYDNNDKPTYTYDKDSQALVTSSGNKVTGNAYVGYEKYGLNICGKEVTKENRENIIVQSWIYKNTLSYDPYNKTLSVNNARLILGADYMTASEQFGHAVINNQIDGLTIRTKGECDIADLNSSAIYSSGSLNFKGSGELYIGGVRKVSDKAIVMRQSASQLSFSGLDVIVNGKVNLNGGKLNLASSDVKFNDGIQNMGAFTKDSTEIATPGVFYDIDNKYFCKAGTASAYEGEIEFVRVKTYYGIEVCGMKVTDRNCANIVPPFMESGTLTYDPEANVLTLTDVTIDTKSHPRIPGFRFYGVAHAPVTICLRGNNVVKKMFVSSSGIFCKRPSDATDDSEPHYIIRGNGSLTMEDEIECQGCNISFGDGTDEVPTINALNLLSFNDGEGEVWFNRCEMNLTGNGTSHTIRGFADIHTMSGTNINYPEGATYNTGAYTFCLMSGDGKDWREEVKIGGETYGLKVLGVEVTSFNKDNIVDGVIYNPSTHTLYMKNTSLSSQDTPCIENTGNNLIIKCEGGDMTNLGNAPTIYTTKSIEIQASSFDIYNLRDCVIKMAGSGQYIKFNNCDDLRIEGDNVVLDAEPENSYRLYVEKSNLTIVGASSHTARGISFYDLNNTGISSERVYIQPANAQFPDGGFFLWGENGACEEYLGDVEFKRVTTDFGIIISGHRLNDVNAKNFYFDDITSGEVSFEYASQYYWLTLSGVTAQCTRIGYVDGKLVQLNSNGINITASRPGTVHINLKGENTFNNIDGMGMAIFKDVDIYGDGTLNMGTKSIGSYNGADITIKDCTVNAGRLVGSNNGGYLWVEHADLHLTGGTSGQSAISKFELVGLDGCAITSPVSCIYDPDARNLLVDGSVYTGAVDITAYTEPVISVEDITALIDQYLEPDSDITIEDITNLIDRYLEQ